MLAGIRYLSRVLLLRRATISVSVLLFIYIPYTAYPHFNVICGPTIMICHVMWCNIGTMYNKFINFVKCHICALKFSKV